MSEKPWTSPHSTPALAHPQDQRQDYGFEVVEHIPENAHAEPSFVGQDVPRRRELAHPRIGGVDAPCAEPRIHCRQ